MRAEELGKNISPEKKLFISNRGKKFFGPSFDTPSKKYLARLGKNKYSDFGLVLGSLLKMI